MHICFFIASFGDGGAQKQCIFLLNEFQKRPDLEVSLISFADGVHDELLEYNRINVTRLSVRSLYDCRIPFKLRAFLRRTSPDVFVSWLPNCDVPAALVRRAHPKLRWIMTERNSDYPMKNPRFLARKVLGRWADAVIANSAKGASYWASTVDVNKRFIVPNIIQPVIPVPLSDPPTVAIIGRLEPQKNAQAVIDAFVQLALCRPGLRFNIIGIGSLESAIREQVEGYEAISCLGFRKDISEQIGRSNVIVTMSHREGLPNVLLEAVAGNRLVVASDIPEHREVLGPDYPFYVQNRNDPTAIAAAIEQACSYTSDGSILEYARSQLAKMNAPAIADRYVEIFKQICPD